MIGLHHTRLRGNVLTSYAILFYNKLPGVKKSIVCTNYTTNKEVHQLTFYATPPRKYSQKSHLMPSSSIRMLTNKTKNEKIGEKNSTGRKPGGYGNKNST